MAKIEKEPNFIQTLIRQRRMDLGLSQAALAKAMGLKAPEFIALMEKGQRDLVLQRAATCADALVIDRVTFTKLVLQHEAPSAFQVLFPGEDPEADLSEAEEVDTRKTEKDDLLGKFNTLPKGARDTVLEMVNQLHAVRSR